MKKLIIGVDIDGVLANFNVAFAKLLQKLSGRTLVDPESINPTEWHWPQAIGYTSKEIDACWRDIQTSSGFWAGLAPLPNVSYFLWALKRSAHDVYFATARPGLSAKHQTEVWLAHHGYSLPTVLITEQKWVIAKALKFDAYIDDNRGNCLDVALTGGTRVYMPRAGYNRGEVGRVVEIGNIMEMLDAEHIVYDEKVAA